MQNETKLQNIDNVENIKNKKATKKIILKQHTAPDIKHDNNDKNIENQQKELLNAEMKIKKSEKEFAQLLKGIIERQ